MHDSMFHSNFECIEKGEWDGETKCYSFLMLSSHLCFYPKNVYTVSFPKPGFVELSPVPIDVGTEINLSFSTKNESGIILLGSGGTPIPPRRKRRQTGQVITTPNKYNKNKIIVNKKI